MSTTRARLRRLVPAIVPIPLLVGLMVGANLAVASPVNADQVAASYKFQGMPIAMPPGYHPTQTLRPVNGAYQHLVSWISSVGAGALGVNEGFRAAWTRQQDTAFLKGFADRRDPET